MTDRNGFWRKKILYRLYVNLTKGCLFTFCLRESAKREKGTFFATSYAGSFDFAAFGHKGLIAREEPFSFSPCVKYLKIHFYNLG